MRAMSEPTERQLNYLAVLQYFGPTPHSVEAASRLIDALKNGLRPEDAPAHLEVIHRELVQAQLPQVREYLLAQLKMNELSRTCIGFRLSRLPGHSGDECRLYHKAFISLETACLYPEILLTYGLCYEPLQRRPSTGLFVIAPGQVEKRGKVQDTEESTGQPQPVVPVTVDVKPATRRTTKNKGCLLMVVCAMTICVLTSIGFAAIWLQR